MGRLLRWGRSAGVAAVVAAAGLAFGVQAAPSAGMQTPQQPQPSAPQEQRPAQAPAPAPDQTQKPPVFRGGVNVVRVDVIVSDKTGGPVTNLTAADFEVYEDGKLQTIDLFKLVNSDGNVRPGSDPARPIRSLYDQESEAARDDVRLFVIFLDDYHVRKGNSMRVRETLAEFVRTQLGPLDMAAVMTPLMSINEVTFTRDTGSLEASMRAFEGCKFDYRPRNAIEERYTRYPSQTVETIRNEVTMTALRGLSVKLGAMREGRKAVIFVSEGFLSLLPPQMRDVIAEMPGLGNSAARSPFAGESAVEERMRVSADTQLLMDLRQVFDAANRNNVAIYSLDPRGLAVNEFDINETVSGRTDQEYLRRTQDTLQVLSSNTDGRAIVNRNDIQGGLKQIIRDTSAYYLLSFTTSVTAPDGKFHEIKVRLKRPGLQVRSRKGYWALTAEEAAKAAAPPKPATPPAVEKALSDVAIRRRDALIATWFGTSRAEDGGTRVTFAWDPLPPIPGEKREEVTRVQVLASGKGGEEYFRGSVPPEPPATPGPHPASSVSFTAPPGRLQLRVTVQNEKGQVLDTLVQELVVPDFSGTDVRLSTPVVLRARTAREFQSLSRDPYAVPTSVREFRRTDRLIIRFFAHVPGASAPEVSVRLLNRAGQKMVDLPAVAPAEAGQPHVVDLPLASLSPSEYIIEIKTKGVSGEAAELIGIRVVS